MIVDCHAHWGTVWEERDHGNPTRWLECLDRHNITASYLMGYLNLMRQDLASQDNDNLAQLARHAPKRLFPLATTWPQLGEAAVAEVVRCAEKLKVKGLKFHPWLQGFSLTDLTFGKICGLAGELRLPIFFHDGTPCYSLPEQVGALARRFPKTRFVLGHAGLLWTWRSAILAAQRPNVWICLCGPHSRAIEIICEQAPDERILWGSDWGPRLSDDIEYRLNLFLRAKVRSKLREQILGVNPMRLLGYP